MNTGFHFGGDELFIVDMREAPVLLAVMAAAVVAEVFLARKKDGRLGLVLPGISLLWTVARLIIRVVQVSNTAEVVAPGQLLLLAWLVENVPTLILLAVCGLCRVWRRQWTTRQLKKTHIEDL